MAEHYIYLPSLLYFREIEVQPAKFDVYGSKHKLLRVLNFI